jgi:hypothetical protein
MGAQGDAHSRTRILRYGGDPSVEKENHRKMIRDFVERKNSGALPSRTEITQERMCNKKTTHDNGLFTRDRDGCRKEEEATRDLLNYDGCGDGQKPPENLLGQIRQFFTAHQKLQRCKMWNNVRYKWRGKTKPRANFILNTDHDETATRNKNPKAKKHCERQTYIQTEKAREKEELINSGCSVIAVLSRKRE